MKQEIQPVFSQCNEPLSIKYIVLDCPLYVNSRSILNKPSSMKEALGEHNSHLIHIP
ncbi:RNase H domain-containing protein [Aphis craccivora]|uniref:RNase H domain-containing protein n=1 Tax=Aphis craccivora TaxID=307492 RepID=A0A6G0VTZ4_APHCR|nr:RNase H domain-containing protein [Aphis craccivora]